MRIVVSAQGDTLEAEASPVFGRCPTYVFVDTATMQFQAMPNPAANQGGGAGIQAAQFVVEQGAQALLSGNLGPNAFDVLEAAGIPTYVVSEGTVFQAVEAFKANRLQPMSGANVAAHAGMGGGGGSGMRRGVGGSVQPAAEAPPEQELAQLQESLKALRQQLAATMDRIEQLERGTNQKQEG